MEKRHAGCCGCHLHGDHGQANQHGLTRRGFFVAAGGGAAGLAMLTAARAAGAQGATTPFDVVPPKPLRVLPVLSVTLYQRAEKRSWRPWGGLHTEEDIAAEVERIRGELAQLKTMAGVPVEFLDVVQFRPETNRDAIIGADADVLLIYGATGEVRPLITPDKWNILFVRHKSGPVSLWYEIAHPRLLRRETDHCVIEGLTPEDVVVDDLNDVAWRLRALYGLRNTIGARVVCVGGPSGWNDGGKMATRICREQWKMDLPTVTYDELAERIKAAFSNESMARQAVADAAAWLADPAISLETDRGYVERAFLLARVFEQLMREHDCSAITVNECMGTIMPIADTTACLTLTLLNDAGAMAFCESDFVVIPSGILLHHISGLPVFLNDPTYPHHGQITLAHCTAPRKLDGKTLAPARIVTHYESDFGAAPKVDMALGQVTTTLVPDFENRIWHGFTGKVLDNPFLDICRSQIDVSIDGDWKRLVTGMRGFHWMTVYGDWLKETGYALSKAGVRWRNLTSGATVEV